MKYCALCCIAKDEDPFLKEWLAYHALIGFEHFILYDDVSATPIADLLKGWTSPEHVTIIRHAEHRDQPTAYAHCLETFGKRFKWIAFLDLDEFLRLGPVNPGRESAHDPWCTDVRAFLAEFEPYAALGLNWRMFSWSGHKKSPEGPVIGSYTRCQGDDVHIKSIVQPAKIRDCAGAHSFNPLPGHHAVNADHFPIPPGFPFTVPATDRAAVNHYYYKSRQCFEKKIARGNPCNIQRRMSDFDHHVSLPDARDESLLPWADSVDQACLAARMPVAQAPVSLPSEQLPEEVSDGLTNARYYVRKARERGGADNRDFLAQALLHLARISILNEADGEPDPVIDLEVWTLRAEAALLCGRDELAEFYIRQAFIYGAGQRTFTELANLLLRKGRQKDAKYILSILKIFREQL